MDTRRTFTKGYMKQIFSLIVTIIASSIVSVADSAEIATTNSEAIHGFWDNSIRDHYVSYRISRKVNKTPVWWSELEVDLPWRGIYFDLWSSDALNSSKSQQKANEFDVSVGKRTKIGDLTIDCQLRYFNFDSVGDWFDAGDFMGAGMLATYKEYQIGYNNSIQPAIDIEWLSKLEDLNTSGPIVQPGLIHKWKAPFGLKCLTIVDKDWVCWADCRFKKDDTSGLMFRTDAAFVWALSKHFELSVPGLRLITPIVETADGRRTVVSVWGSLRFKF